MIYVVIYALYVYLCYVCFQQTVVMAYYILNYKVS